MKNYLEFQNYLGSQLDAIRAAGTYKRERTITTPQGAMVETTDGKPVLNMCANNYLGLAQDPRIKQAAHDALEQWGYGLASVRFICGTQRVHQDLEDSLADFLGTEDTILYGSCFDANGGLFETVLGLETNTRYFRNAMTEAGFNLAPGSHPIVPVMLGDAALATRFADAMLERGVYVIGFSYPVVPQGKARIRTQISAAHTQEDLQRAVAAFVEVRRDLGIQP
jgi:7-keto-8-aminopelargonate synthetase-like enzyme